MSTLLLLGSSLMHASAVAKAKKEAEMVQKIIEKVKAECRAQGEDLDRRGYTKHAN